MTVRVTDSNSPPLSVEQAVSITVRDIAPAVALDPGVAATQTADFSDMGFFVSTTPGSFTATVNYGDGAGLLPLALSPIGTFVLAHTYTRPGTFTVTVDVQDSFGGVGTAQLAVTATAAPLVSGFGARRDAFVTALFRKGLGRLPDPKSLTFWSKRLAERVPPKAVARQIWRNPEHRRLVHQGLVARIPFQRSYADALRPVVARARLHLPPPAGPLSLTVRSS